MLYSNIYVFKIRDRFLSVSNILNIFLIYRELQLNSSITLLYPTFARGDPSSSNYKEGIFSQEIKSILEVRGCIDRNGIRKRVEKEFSAKNGHIGPLKGKKSRITVSKLCGRPVR